jgi:hypothetical protein
VPDLNDRKAFFFKVHGLKNFFPRFFSLFFELFFPSTNVDCKKRNPKLCAAQFVSTKKNLSIKKKKKKTHHERTTLVLRGLHRLQV